MAQDKTSPISQTTHARRALDRTKDQQTLAETVDHHRLEALVAGQGQVLELITQHAPLPTILEAITRWVEAQAQDGLLASILLLDSEGTHLLHGAAPSLPTAYNEAIHGIAIGPDVGSCGTAAFTQRRVIVADIAEDPLWQDYRDLALRHGLRACWSTPLLGSNGAVLGTFAVYYQQPRQPTIDDLLIIQLVTRTAVLAIEHQRDEEERERMQSRELMALRQAEVERQNLYNLLMQTPAIIVVLRGPDHVFEFANPLYMQTIGVGREILGKPVREALPELAGQGLFELLDSLYATGAPYVGNEVFVKLDRQENGILEDTYFNFVYQPNKNEAGDITSILVHAVDVTELVQARKAVEESEAKFRALADNITQLAWMTDASGWIFWYNKRWYEYTGTTLPEMEGWGWQSVHHPDHVERVVAKVSHAFATGEVWEDTFPLRGSDGQYRWFLSRAVPIHDEQGKVFRWFGTNTDVTEQRRMEQQKDDFIGIASHELKTPVTSLKTYAQVLALRFRKSGDQRSAELLEKMDGQLNKLNSLIGDLLDVTKIESGKLQMQETSFVYADLVAEIVEETQRTAPQYTIIQDLSSATTMFGDRDRIGQVLTNLITNAIKYSPRADTVIVKTSVTADALVTAVQDFGIGIASEKQAQVFERFFRVEGERQETFPGLGLGLFISAEIVRRHQGRMWVESEAEKGSTFFFSLPLAFEPTSTNTTEGTSADA